MRDVVTVAEHYTLELKTYCSGELFGVGSGVMWKSDLSLTAAHVAKSAKEHGCKLVVTNYHGDTAVAKVVQYYADKDVAVIQHPGLGVGVELKFSTDLWRGMPVFTVGYPNSPDHEPSGLTVTRGEVAAFNGWNGFTRHTAPTYFGCSGGPVFDLEGRLVGLMLGVYAFDPDEKDEYGPMLYEGWHFMRDSRELLKLVK